MVREGLTRVLDEQALKLIAYEVVRDNRGDIREGLIRLSDTMAPEVIFTVGGTGVRPTDWGPEATRDVIDKEIPGVGEAMRAESLKKVRTAMLSRGTAGVRGTTLIVNLPGSPKGARENLAVVMPILEHTAQKISGGSNVAI